MKITTNNFYKYAPETVKVFVNGQEIDTTGTMIKSQIASGNTEEATKEIKRSYRKQIRKESNFIYVFFAENSNKFYYIPALQFPATATMQEKLRTYKEAKKYFKENPITVIIETGNPYRSTKPETREEIKIDFTRTSKYKIK